MANTYSSLKRVRQTKRRTAVNRNTKGALRAGLREMRETLQAAGDAAKGAIATLVPATLSRIDKSASKGLIHKRTAARLKSRLMARVHRTAKSA